MTAAEPSLVLVGAVHRDPGGEESLLELLERLRPDSITLEMSRRALVYRLYRTPLLLERLERILDRLAAGDEAERQRLSNHPALADIRALLALPFEYRAARDYAAATGIPLALIDRSDVSARKLERVEEELVTFRNIRTLLRLPPGDGSSRPEGYGAARSMVFGRAGEEVRRAFLAGRRGEEGIGMRDRWMETAIRRRLAARPAGRLVHVGGWVHLVADPEGETLYSRLRDLEPERILLG